MNSSISLLLAEITETYAGMVLAIVPDSLSAAQIERELHFFITDKNQFPIYSFPDWETLPYDTFSPHQDIVSERLTTLYRLSSLKRGVLVVPISTLMHRISPVEFLRQYTLLMKKGDKIHLETLRSQLEQSGYHCVPEVREHGEFAVRGSIIDLFPMGSHVPFRIDLFEDEIETLRTFDIETQRTLTKVEEISLLPAREFPLSKEGISHFRTQFRETFEGDPRQCSLYLDVSEGFASPGLEYYLPLFFEKTNTLFDYLPPHTQVVRVGAVDSTADTFWRQVKERHEQYRHDRLRPILEPKGLFLQPTEIFEKINSNFSQRKLTGTKEVQNTLDSDIQIETLPDLTVLPKQDIPLSNLRHFLKNFSGHVLFCAESKGRREILNELLKGADIHPTSFEKQADFLESQEPLGLCIGSIDEGFIFTRVKKGPIALITESLLFGKRVMQRRLRKSSKEPIEIGVRSLAELTLGAPVVHIEHGIGRYLGLTHLTLSGIEAEFVTLEYAGGDKLYVPVASLHLINRYSGVDIEHAPLHRLGTDQWQKTKQKAIEDARDVASELLEIYAKREAKKGFAFAPPDEHFEAFSLDFPFEETPDQLRAIQEVIHDLTLDKPMDRVVCGDVGFGKTEVALRAAFLAVAGGKQVAVLVPTTLLTEQHFQTFTDRFSEFPIKIAALSRFRTKAEQKHIIEKVETGKIDILIGTHKILQEDIKFKALGLLIIDEEHRFGVRQKDAFKAMRAEVDILTLTATPIPRTLNMALTGMRDLSIIATPPLRRLSIKTFVRERSSALIQEAILRELNRGGQVYFLHNAVDSIDLEAQKLAELIPSARIAVAHGQMHERDLEQVMSDFYHRRYNVLVCTTIIETGIDIPTANTIIIDRADKFGLAQLHQLRGRVGRSHHQAYAFCLLPAKTKITRDAEKRLEALASSEELGAGFTLATHDLEIRGAGELLGDSQSGNIQSVGFELYMELLDHTVKTLQSGGMLTDEFPLKDEIEVDLKLPALIPESYLPDVHSRLMLYKRMSSCKTKERLEDLKSEMIDRFGILPNQTTTLFKITELKLLAAPLGIRKIEVGPKGGRLEFTPKPNIDPAKILHLLQDAKGVYSLEGPQKLKFKMDLTEKETRIETLKQLIVNLS